MFALRNRGGSEAVEALGASFAAQSALLKHEVGCCAVLCCAVRRFGVLCCVVGVRRRLLSGTPAGACVGVPSLRWADCDTPASLAHHCTSLLLEMLASSQPALFTTPVQVAYVLGQMQDAHAVATLK